MIIFITTKAFWKPQSIKLCKVYNVPGVHLASQRNNFKNDLQNWQQPATLRNTYLTVYFFLISLYITIVIFIQLLSLTVDLSL